ncbi:MAG TPA: dihydrofolate reductase [Flavobacteriaceae bacterium]|nr:dihydrofolate reductase [Flavobacteriaceae bacterium]
METDKGKFVIKHNDTSHFPKMFEADAFFPEIHENQWQLITEEFHPKDDRHNYAFTYLTYIRK